jgi:hypothetical protein
MNKVRWLFTEIRDCCIEQWNLGQFITIDEMMVRYKGSYCPARQYMPKKPEKWGMKIWCLADSVTRFVYNFDVYCGASYESIGDPKSKKGEAKQGQRVVESLVGGLDDLGHVVVMDNFFSSVELFRDLERRGIYATGTIRANRIGLPHIFKNLVAFKKKTVTQGTLEWRMHDDCKMSSVMWKDKKPVLLISTHARPVAFPCEIVEVPRRVGAVRKKIKTSPMHLQYTTHMRGVDVADHVRTNYFSTGRSHKWWHRLWDFLVDTSISNMWIIHKTALTASNSGKNILNHFQFVMSMCKALTKNWEGQRLCTSILVDKMPKIHCPMKSHLRRVCVLCKKRTNSFCAPCNFQWMCYTRGCFLKLHRHHGACS